MPKTAIQQKAYDKIEDLVEHFASQIEVFKKHQKEDETRIQFINPLFGALGWDMDNTQRRAIDSEKDVIHEDRLKIAGKSKAPDYSFCVGGERKFFLEAKKPSVQIKTDIAPSHQLRRYGWSAKLPISILTDFEEFAMYDCTKQPNETDAATVGRLKYITFDQYLTEFDWLWDLFSKEQVAKGSLSQFAKTDKKGTQSVDSAFLQSLDEWRNLLATNIAIRNNHLNEDEINYIVQMNINRIVFLRNCEDRGAEPYGKLKECLINSKDEAGYFRNMYQLFGDADRKYNSGLFDFSKDTFSKSVVIDNQVINTVVNELYYPKSPYEFSVIGAEILGTAYERFLGKVIRLTPDHQAVVEEKPEVRKAGGVFYTPQYIVEYIVKNTVGKLVEGKKPEEIAKIKVCDPACGSGSFLLGAYQFLLNYHTDWYNKHYKQNRNLKNSPLTPDGRLTASVKKQILLNNIFGVDIDTQAVEVTKLSLLMKCMEGETTASMQTTMTFERVLPTLDNNIKSGNSLIDFDFYEGQLDFGEDKKIKPFNWKQGFPQVFKQGGFDAIIGNPPYRLMQPKEVDSAILSFFKTRYTFSEFKIDLFHLFFQKAVIILKQNGLLGYIAPSSLLNNVYVENLRLWLLNNCKIDIIAVSHEKVFADADVHTAVYIFEKNSDSLTTDNSHINITFELERHNFHAEIKYNTVKQKRFREVEGKVWNILLNENNVTIINKAKHKSSTLKQIANINRGLITGDKDNFFSNIKVNEKYVPILAGGDVFRYYVNETSKYVLFERPKTSGGSWDEEMHFSKHKILIRQIGTKPTASIIETPIAITGNIFSIRAENVEDEKYILGIINSKFIEYFWKINFTDFKSTFPQVTIFSLGLIPIKSIDVNDKKQSNERNEIVKTVDLLLRLNTDLQTENDAKKKEQMQGMIAFSEQRINEIVYQLYELTPEEIKIVEGQS